jgi:hypothetical protein
VYDEAIRRVVLITGHDGGARPASAEVWTFDGRRWERLEGAGLPSRFLSASAYDSRRQRLVVFGGRVGPTAAVAGDTWVRDGGHWREAADTAADVREHHAMAYDSVRGRIVMYGGTSSVAAEAAGQVVRRWPDHVSEWDGRSWRRINASGPGARNGAAVAFDAPRRQIVLFGGVGEDRVYRPGTWTWDGRTWREVATDGPPLRATHQMAFDESEGVVLLYGGGFTDGTNSLRRADMWRWDGARWSEVVMRGPTPGPRVGHAMAFDRARGRLVLFGGFGDGGALLGDTWEWDGRTWTEVLR